MTMNEPRVKQEIGLRKVIRVVLIVGFFSLGLSAGILLDRYLQFARFFTG